MSGTQDWENLIVLTPDDMAPIEKLLLLILIYSLKQSFSTSSITELNCTIIRVTIFVILSRTVVVGTIPDV